MLPADTPRPRRLRTGRSLVHDVRMRRAAVIGLLACACAHRPSVRPASGWHELVSEHFVLATDAPESRGRELLSELEDAHSALRAVSWHAAHDTLARVKVIAFYRPSDAEEVLGSSREGIFYRDLFGSRGIVVQLGGGDSFHKTLNHEIAHQQLSEFVEHAPRWRPPAAPRGRARPPPAAPPRAWPATSRPSASWADRKPSRASPIGSGSGSQTPPPTGTRSWRRARTRSP